MCDNAIINLTGLEGDCMPIDLNIEHLIGELKVRSPNFNCMCEVSSEACSTAPVCRERDLFHLGAPWNIISHCCSTSTYQEKHVRKPQ